MKFKNITLALSSLSLVVPFLVSCNNTEYTVSFDCTDIKETIPSQKVKHGKKASKPDITVTPKESTKKFTGYYNEGKVYNFDLPVTSNLTIFVNVEDNYHTVTFDANGGTIKEEEEKASVLHGKTLTDLPTPTAPQDTYFAYWEDEEEKVFYPTTPIEKDRTLKAKYTEKWIDLSADRNIDSDPLYGKSQLTAEIHGVDVTAQCEFKVVEGYGDDLVKIVKDEDENYYIEPIEDIERSGVALVMASTEYSNSYYEGYFIVSVGSFHELYLGSPGGLGDGCAVIQDSATSKTKILIPSYYYNNGKFITINAIGNDGFKDCTNVESIYMPDTITEIRLLGFAKCPKLTKVRMSDSLISIGQLAFFACPLLETITIPASCEKIESHAFSSCTSLNSAKFEDPDSWKFTDYDFGVDKQLFVDETTAANALRSFYSEDTLIKLKDRPPLLDGQILFLEINNSYNTKFQISSNQSVTYSSTNENIARVENGVIYPVSTGNAQINATNAYGKVTSLYVEVHNTTAYSHYNGYLNCWDSGGNGLVVLPEKIGGTDIIGIATDGFEGSYCGVVYIPDSYVEIRPIAFNECSLLQYIKFGINSRLKTVGNNAFIRCSSLKYVNLPDSVESIGEQAFQSCSSLKHVHLPINSKFTTINSYTFHRSGIEDVAIPSSVTTINDYAFNKCTNLQTISFGGTVDAFTTIINGRSKSQIFEGVPATYVQCNNGTYTFPTN